MSLRLSEMNLLVGQTEELTLVELRKRVGDVIAQVRLGKVFTITKSGKSVATLARPEPTALEIGAEVRRLGLMGPCSHMWVIHKDRVKRCRRCHAVKEADSSPQMVTETEKR